ncbi:MAG: hypothetical protein AB7P21_17435 [Lautropia sp.]
MSFVGTLVAAFIRPADMPPRLDSIDDLASVELDEANAVYLFSRNGWVNDRIEELSSLGHLPRLPTRRLPASVFDSRSLSELKADLDAFLKNLPREPGLLSEAARELAEEEDVARCAQLAPATLQAAFAALNAARSRDEEAEGLETLVCLLWCLLRMAEHAEAHELTLIVIRSQ